jgi:hypothetical protein
VSVTWTKRTGEVRKGPAGPGADAEVSKNLIPAKYNSNTELRAAVSKDKPRHDFPLSSK